MSNARSWSLRAVLIHLLILLCPLGQSAVLAQDADDLDQVRTRFAESSALDWAIRSHRREDPASTLAFVSWALSDEHKTCRDGWVTIKGTSGSVLCRFDWSTSATGHKDLSAEDMGAVRDALVDLPASTTPESLEDIVLVSYWSHNRWMHRVYDRRTPPEALTGLARTAGLSVFVALERAPN